MTAKLGTGYLPGLLGWTVAEHGRYYAEHWGFGPYFETKVAREMADFVGRLDQPENKLFWAADDAGPLATLSLDGGDADQRLFHLRWFVTAARARGQGLGQRLISACVATARELGAAGIYLTTFSGLDAARRLYAKAGFTLVHEAEDSTWGTPVMEQRFELRF